MNKFDSDISRPPRGKARGAQNELPPAEANPASCQSRGMCCNDLAARYELESTSEVFVALLKSLAHAEGQFELEDPLPFPFNALHGEKVIFPR
jgi:hypothetical protein